MEFSKMSPYITFSMGIAGGGASSALLSRAAESRVEGQQKEFFFFKLKYTFSYSTMSTILSQIYEKSINVIYFKSS